MTEELNEEPVYEEEVLPVQEPGLDELYEASIDHQEVRGIEEDSLLPVGSYHTVIPLTVKSQVIQDGDDQGRIVLRVFGGLVLVKRNTATKLYEEQPRRGSLGFAVSHERRNKILRDGDGNILRDEMGVALRSPTEPDTASRLWKDAVTAYTVAYGFKAGQVGQIIEFLSSYAVRVRVIQMGVPTERRPEPTMEPRNLVMGITAIKTEEVVPF